MLCDVAAVGSQIWTEILHLFPFCGMKLFFKANCTPDSDLAHYIRPKGSIFASLTFTLNTVILLLWEAHAAACLFTGADLGVGVQGLLCISNTNYM